METPSSVSQWAEETFGSVGSNFSVACRANQEMSELLSAVAADERHPELGEEIADVVICLWRLGQRNSFDLQSPPCPRMLLPLFAEGRTCRIVTEINQVMSGLLRALARDDNSFTLEGDLGWLAVSLRLLSRRCGINLQAEIDSKMKTNRARTWALDGNGHGSHVEEPPANHSPAADARCREGETNGGRTNR